MTSGVKSGLVEHFLLTESREEEFHISIRLFYYQLYSVLEKWLPSSINGFLSIRISWWLINNVFFLCKFCNWKFKKLVISDFWYESPLPGKYIFYGIGPRFLGNYYYLNKKLGLFMSFLYNIYKTCSRFYDLFLMISNILLIPTI